MLVPLLRCLLLLVLVASDFVCVVSGFAVPPIPTCRFSTKHGQLGATTVSLDAIADIGYIVSVSRPLGVIFGENNEPFLGLQVEDVELGLPGGVAGLRVGDQLVAVNDQVVIGKDFDSVMEFMRSSDMLELQLFRGSVRQLYNIIGNRQIEGDDDDDENDDDFVVMDESYESPVTVPLAEEEEEPLTAGDLLNGLKVLGSKVVEGVAKHQGNSDKNTKKGLFGGIFGGGETIQLDGSDASTLK